jgi:hypothetical protein
MDLDTLTRMLDRYGLPTAILAAIFWLAYRIVVGPATRLADKLGDGAATLAKSASEFLANLTQSMQRLHVEHVEMLSHVTAEAVGVREHVSEEVGKMRDRLSAAEDSIEVTVRQATGQHAAYCGTPPMGIQATPRVDSRQPVDATTVRP